MTVGSDIPNTGKPEDGALSSDPMNVAWAGDLVALVTVGAGIGWLLGLSISPVVANVVSALIAVVATLVATLGGWEQKTNKTDIEEQKTNTTDSVVPEQVAEADPVNTSATTVANSSPAPRPFPRIITPWPFAALMIGIFLGSIAGLSARNHSLFGSNLSYEVEKWTAQGMSKDEVVRRLFELDHPYTPYVQPWFWITDTLPMTSSVIISSAIASPQFQLTSALSTEVQTWANFGLDRTEVVSRFFELKYPSSSITGLTVLNEQSTSGISREVDKTAGLNTGSSNGQASDRQCTFFRNKSWDKLKDSLDIQEELNNIVQDQDVQNQLLNKIFTTLCPN